MKIDAHQHFWKLSENLNDWPTTDLPAIYKDFMPEDLRQHLQRHSIDKTIVVQAAPLTEETDFLLDVASRTDFIGGVVGWLDLSSDQFPAHLLTYMENPKFVGIRPMLQNLEDDRWILRDDVKRNISILVEHNIPLDILIFPKHLPVIIELLTAFPTLRAVIDHCAKPAIAEKQWAAWADLMTEVAFFDSVMCKISGLVTEADHEAWTIDDFKPYIQHLVTCFGPNRLMFGSDWPVCLLAAHYDEVVNIVTHHVSDQLTEADAALLFGGNAQTFYNI